MSPLVYENIIEVIGHTPLVKLHAMAEGLACNLYGKCEFLSPGAPSKIASLAR